jgi:AraC-like DNA-binding protein
MTHPVRFPKVRFSTADLPERGRLTMWREHYCHTIMRVAIDPACDASFGATVISRAFPELHLIDAALSAVHTTRTRELLADGNNDFALVINRAGRMAVTARGRELELRQGDAVLVNSGEMIAFERPTFGSSFSVRIPYPVLSSLVVDADDAVMRLIPRSTGVLNLLTSYAYPLLEEDELTTPELRHLAVPHVHDLVALTLGATRDAGAVAQNRGVSAARLRAAKAYIIENSNSSSLSIGSVAKHIEVTPRYLQRLFEGDGTTFSTFLLGQRLARAYRMLASPKFDSHQVSAVAYEVGFGDLSYFHRCFRQRYGATPRDIRESIEMRSEPQPDEMP